eukprot:Hpha_TRINITY_DN35746_c0_g1::TRINITY_DN35746_c0_g1_i1::g.139968::m.139968
MSDGIFEDRFSEPIPVSSFAPGVQRSWRAVAREGDPGTVNIPTRVTPQQARLMGVDPALVQRQGVLAERLMDAVHSAASSLGSSVPSSKPHKPRDQSARYLQSSNTRAYFEAVGGNQYAVSDTANHFATAPDPSAVAPPPAAGEPAAAAEARRIAGVLANPSSDLNEEEVDNLLRRAGECRQYVDMPDPRLAFSPPRRDHLPQSRLGPPLVGALASLSQVREDLRQRTLAVLSKHPEATNPLPRRPPS